MDWNLDYEEQWTNSLCYEGTGDINEQLTATRGEKVSQNEEADVGVNEGEFED